MSWMMRRSARSTREASCNGIVRRMVSLPRNILGEFSRAMDQGMDLIGIGGRRNQHQPSNFPLQHPNFPFQHPQQQPEVVIQEEWAFLASFEQQYGTIHPFFYACRFTEALKIAQDEIKFVFISLHSPENNPFTSPFCREALCSELVVQFIDANFVSWGGLANRGEGLQLTTTLKPASFPFCAVVAPASGDGITVLQQMEGAVSPAELVEILQRTMEEQGLAFGSATAKEEEKRREDQLLREEQEVENLAALQIDKEKERPKNLPSEERAKKQVDVPNKVNYEKSEQNPTRKQSCNAKEGTTTSDFPPQDIGSRGKDDQLTQVPNFVMA
ncbi:hypothetical protein F0562_023591 [Nyssa sinensis]|uniref:UAS domain-containing protein n=1 Tax=Nyssa sinensis TaxID=561372 RepID=A0A5J5BHW8_9ASTE|nr:hypothetical protein F0562_023591 [Nyssa sinensis]